MIAFILPAGEGSACPSLRLLWRGSQKPLGLRNFTLDLWIVVFLRAYFAKSSEPGSKAGPRSREAVAGRPGHLPSSQFLHLQSESQSPQTHHGKMLVSVANRFLPVGHPGHSADTSAFWP